MSTLKVDAIRHNSATSDAITTAADGTCTAKLTSNRIRSLTPTLVWFAFVIL